MRKDTVEKVVGCALILLALLLVIMVVAFCKSRRDKQPFWKTFFVLLSYGDWFNW